jgi:hypothetical protein
VRTDVSGTRQVAITIEMAPGARKPTSTPIFAAPVSA